MSSAKGIRFPFALGVQASWQLNPLTFSKVSTPALCYRRVTNNLKCLKGVGAGYLKDIHVYLQDKPCIKSLNDPMGFIRDSKMKSYFCLGVFPKMLLHYFPFVSFVISQQLMYRQLSLCSAQSSMPRHSAKF